MRVGELLDLGLGATQIVLGDLAVLLGALELGVGVAADVAHGDPRVLGVVLALLDEVLAALLGQRRERQADDRAVVARRDAEVGGLDGLLDRLERGLVPRLDDEQLRLRRS